MTIEANQPLPDATLRRLTDQGLEEISTRELTAGKRVVFFTVPGAFSPTCQDRHLPGYVVRAPDLKAKGADRVIGIAVNDPFVMKAWGAASALGEDVELFSDGNGELAEALGLVLDLSPIGWGKRFQRAAMIVDDGIVTYLGVEPGRDVTVSGAEAVLEALEGARSERV